MDVCRFLTMHVRLVLEGGLANLYGMVCGLRVSTVWVSWCLLHYNELFSESVISSPLIYVWALTFWIVLCVKTMLRVGIWMKLVVTSGLGGGLFTGNLNDVHGWLWNKTPYIQKNYKRKKKCIGTNNRLENKLMYLYWAFQFNVIHASTTYTIL